MRACVRGGGLADIFPFTSHQGFRKLKLSKGNTPNINSILKMILNTIGLGFSNCAKLKTLSNDT
jgi:hypothetical protein